MDTQKASDLLTQRYGVSDTIPNAAVSLVNPVIETILAHRSVRAYSDQPLPEGTMEILTAAAESASTSSNLHAYSIIAVTDNARKDECARLCGNQKHIRDAPLFLVFCADLARMAYVCEREGTAHAGLDYMEMLLIAVVDASLASQNAATAAESLGLGTCYIGGARNHPLEIAEVLRLPERVFALFGLTVGVPSTHQEDIKPRYSQEGILHRETYDAGFEPSVAAYDATMEAFNGKQLGRQGRGWATVTANRAATPEALGADRPRIKEILAERKLGMK